MGIYDHSSDTKISVLSSNIYNTHLLFELNNYEFILADDSDDKYLIHIDHSTSMLDVGKPNLPKISTSIIIPDNLNMELEIVNAEYEEIENVFIAPSKGNLSRDVNPQLVAYSFDKIYKEDVFYPGDLSELGNPYIIKNIRGQGVVFYPVQYNPFSKTVRIYTEIEVKIKSNGISNYNVLNKSIPEFELSREFNQIYKNLFINSNQDLRFDYVPDYGNMLVISYDDFMEDVQPLVDWKNKKGIKTEMVAVSEAGNTAEDIKNYIVDYYSQNGLTYLLLVGDAEQIPTPIINNASSDPSYGFIEGDDSFAEVIVGRFSSQNPAHVQTQVLRTLNYEMNPNEIDYFDVALGVASNQGPGYGGLSDDEFNDLLWNDFLSDFTYSEFHEIYDPSGSVSQGVELINNGVGIINYTGHAGQSGWGNGAPLSATDVQGLMNVDKLPFVFTVGCNPGEFNTSNECFCESWLRSTDNDGNPIGAVAHLGSTISQSWEPPMHGQWAMNAILSESYDDNSSRTFGGIAVNGCMHMNEAQGSSGINETNHWTIFGDPSLMIRTESPTNLNPIYNETILIGQTEFIVDVGVDDAVVALSLNNELIISEISIGGVAVLDISDINFELGQIDMVITSFNAYPHMATLNVIAPDGAYLVTSGFELANGSSLDDMIVYGGYFEIDVITENVGSLNANAITVIVETSDQYVTMDNSESSIAYAIVNQPVETDEPFSFSVREDVPDGHVAHFNVNYIYDNNVVEWTGSFLIEIYAPVFEVQNPVFSDSNSDGVWNPGETAIIDVELVNSGSAGFGYYPGAVITTDNPYITILSHENSNTFYGIDANTTYEGQFEVLADESTPMGTEVEFNISWGYSPTAPCDNDYFSGGGCVNQANFTYTAIVGHASILIWDPSDFHISGSRLVEYFNNNNISGYDYYDSIEVPSADLYSNIFIFLGVYPYNYVLQEQDIAGFLNFLDSGGNLYLEGGDTWAFDQTTTLQSMFGIAPLADGTSDLFNINGLDSTFTEGMSFSYNTLDSLDMGNQYIDRLSLDGGFAILENTSSDSLEYITAVAYDNISTGYRTIGASHNLGALQGENFSDYISGILNFFEIGGEGPSQECNMGDVNEDDLIDVADIVNLVNIIIDANHILTDYELCASDLNSDDTINVLDIMVLINIILEPSRIRADIVENINVFEYNDRFEMLVNGPIKGLQLTVASEDDLVFNQNLNMEIDCNKIDNVEDCIIYSLSKDFMPNGQIVLFESSSEYIIEELLIVNADNQLVNIVFNEIQPLYFELKQNYPNPFNPVTNIDFEVYSNSQVKLFIYNISGQLVSVLTDGYYYKGDYSLSWDGKDMKGFPVSSGTYIYSLVSDSYSISKKMTLLK